MPTINIEGGGSLACRSGCILLDALLSGNAFSESPCGGRGLCGKCRVTVLSGAVSEITPDELRLLDKEEIKQGVRLSCMTKVLGDCSIRLPKKESGHRILTGGLLPEFDRDPLKGFGIAADIGTTTIALSLMDLESGKELFSASDINPQKIYGQDVLTRISYEMEHGAKAVADLQSAVIGCMNLLISRLCNESGISPEQILRISVAANCCMTHMLLGINAETLGRSPYQPVFTEAKTVSAAALGLKAGKDTLLYCLPQISAYLGGDITAGATACRLFEETRTVLFIDIGTNGEILLTHGGRILGCSCAAGPALEGMNISCGMRAAEGAVEDVLIHRAITLNTIGDAPPSGLCGSGILASVRELIKGGYIKKTGAFVSCELQPEPRLLIPDGSRRKAVLCGTPEISVTQEDIRQVQLAKGAILSGFTVLLREAGISMEELDLVIVAGQFGSHLPVSSLTGIGLLPECLSDRILYAGNTSKTGAVMALLSEKERRKMEHLAKQIDHIDLVTTKGYEQIFAQCMAFPIKAKENKHE